MILDVCRFNRSYFMILRFKVNCGLVIIQIKTYATAQVLGVQARRAELVLEGRGSVDH